MIAALGVHTVWRMSNFDTKKLASDFEALLGGNADRIFATYEDAIRGIANFIKGARTGDAGANAKVLGDLVDEIAKRATTRTVDVLEAYAGFVKRATGADHLTSDVALKILELTLDATDEGSDVTLIDKLAEKAMPIFIQASVKKQASPFHGFPGFGAGSANGTGHKPPGV